MGKIQCGIIVAYSKDANGGVIADSNGNKYFFDRSEWKSPGSIPVADEIVTFRSYRAGHATNVNRQLLSDSDPNNEYSIQSSSNDTVKAQLRWFNPAKGFGFVVLENEGLDAFIHATTLKRAKLDHIVEGTGLLCRIQHRSKGPLVTEILKVLDHNVDPGSKFKKVFELTGTVKWYDPDRGFGFVTADDGGKDVYLHSTCLLPHGLNNLDPLTPLLMIVKPTVEGREVIEFSFKD